MRPFTAGRDRASAVAHVVVGVAVALVPARPLVGARSLDAYTALTRETIRRRRAIAIASSESLSVRNRRQRRPNAEAARLDTESVRVFRRSEYWRGTALDSGSG
jgi:hypothetical protein